jgi:hypothetical protein
MTRRSQARLAKVVLMVALSVMAALWMRDRARIPGKYAVRVHGADSFAGTWHDYMVLREDGTGRMWNGSQPKSWECTLSWAHSPSGIEITIPHYIYGATYQNYSEPRIYHYEKGLRSLSGTGRNNSRFVFTKTLLQL